MKLISRLQRSKNVRKVYHKVFNLLMLMPKKKNLVIFESFNGRQYSDNPRAIYEYMKENYPNHELVWSVDQRYIDQFSDKGVIYAKRHSIKWIFLMVRASHWVTNSRMPLWFWKSKRTTYLQTWHGTPLKRLGVDIEKVNMPGTTTEKYRKNFLKEAAKWDYLVSPNAYSSDIFKGAFGFNKKILEFGYPRNDFLANFNQKKVDEIKEKIGIDTNKKVILYAPTWRDDEYKSKGNYKLKMQLDLKLLQEQFGEDHVVLLRMHYLISQKLTISDMDGFVYNLSSYEDIRELYVISDILITDYSSVFFDFSILKKPIIFFVYDIDKYRDKLRGFYFDLENNAPGPLVKTNIELINEIKKINENDMQPSQKIGLFSQKFAYLEDGNATERVVKEVFGKSKGAE